MQLSATEVTNAAIQQAEESQERKCPGWKEQAYSFLENYARFHPEFLTEDVRLASIGIIPEPPEPRAWGGIVVRACKAGIISWSGRMAEMKAAHSHRCPKKLWQSNIF